MKSDLWNTLRTANLVAGEPPFADSLEKPQLYLRLLAGLGAWVATLFSLGTAYSLTGPLAALLQVIGVHSHSKAITSSILIMAVIYWGFGIRLEHKNTQSSVFSQQLALACYLIGQGLLGFALAELLHNLYFVATLLTLLNTAVFITLKPTLLKRLSSYLTLICLTWLILMLWGHNVFFMLPLLLALAATVWLNLCRFAPWYAWLEPLAQAASMLYFLGYLWFFMELAAPSGLDWHTQLLSIDSQANWNWHSFQYANGLTSIVSLALGISYWRSSWLGAFLVVFISVVNLWLPGISGLALLLAATVRIGHKTLVIRLLISLLVLLFMFYYSLHLNLLYKSFLLVGSGVVLIIFGTLIRRFTMQEST